VLAEVLACISSEKLGGFETAMEAGAEIGLSETAGLKESDSLALRIRVGLALEDYSLD
jgi:hypothetical protein